MFVIQTYAMELTINEKIYLNRTFSKFELDEQSSIFYTKLESNKQIPLKDELLSRIFAVCSHNTRCAIELTCKQFYNTASIHQLNKLVIYNFVIGDDKEKVAFFKALIKTSNPKLITSLLHHAKKEAESYDFIQPDVVCINLESPESTQKNYIQDRYFNPLVKEALKQENMFMIERLESEKFDTTLIKKYKSEKHDHRHRTTAFALSVLTSISIFGGLFTYIAIHNS